MEKINATIVIWGRDNYNVLGLLRQLTPYIERVIFMVYNEKKRCATWSHFCKETVAVSTYNEGIKYLMEIGASLKEKKGFIITTSDTLAEFIDQNYNVLSVYFHLTGTSRQGLLTKMQSKVEMCKLSKMIGITVPKTFILSTDTNINEFEFPCIIKPEQQTATVHRRFKYKCIDLPSEAENFMTELRPDDHYIVQQFIKREKEYLIYGCRLANGEVIIPGAIIKKRWHYGRVVKEVPKEVNVSLIQEFLDKIDYQGLFSFEYGLMDGNAYFFEVNLRNDGTSLYYYLSGANMPLLWVASFFGKEKEVPQIVERENIFIDGFGDLTSALSKEISLKQWWHDVKNADIYRYYDSRDWKPFVGTAIQILPRQLAKILLGRYKHK